MPVILAAKACRISCSVGKSSLSVSTENPNQKAWLNFLVNLVICKSALDLVLV